MSIRSILHNWREAMRDDDAYATRGANSDIEVRENDQGYIECVDCPMVSDGFYGTWTEDDMAEHIRQHKAAGHRVPITAITNLLRR